MFFFNFVEMQCAYHYKMHTSVQFKAFFILCSYLLRTVAYNALRILILSHHHLCISLLWTEEIRECYDVHSITWWSNICNHITNDGATTHCLYFILLTTTSKRKCSICLWGVWLISYCVMICSCIYFVTTLGCHGWVAFHSVCVRHSLHWQTLGLVPYLSSCELTCYKPGSAGNSFICCFYFLWIYSQERDNWHDSRSILRLLRDGCTVDLQGCTKVQSHRRGINRHMEHRWGTLAIWEIQIKATMNDPSQ